MKVNNSKLLVIIIRLWFLHSALPLIAVYRCVKFHSISLYTIRDMLRTSFSLQKFRLIVLNDTSTLVGHFVSCPNFPKERVKKIEELAEKMKVRDKEERGTEMKVKKQKK